MVVEFAELIKTAMWNCEGIRIRFRAFVHHCTAALQCCTEPLQLCSATLQCCTDSLELCNAALQCCTLTSGPE